eukprot:TRINITY_DN4306_c0_g1_i1.p2 TRINITY_DN4306_c0_g1~~TRINITY_DN4306_c0_g1_i1.p2  ORF type:complete len:489 (-),score=102.99 TRINITY_DN4306_c0_g1_i1:1804-3270(-)
MGRIGVLLLLMLTHSLADLLVVDPVGWAVKNAPAYSVGQTSFSLVNQSVRLLAGRDACSSLSAAPTNGTVIFAYMPLCFPEDIARNMQASQNYSGLLIANGIAPATGLWALNFWRTAKPNEFNFPILDIHINLLIDDYKTIKLVSLSSQSINYFADYSKSGAFIFLLVLAHVTTFLQLCLSIHRIRFQLIHGNPNRHLHSKKRSAKSDLYNKLTSIATVIAIFHFLGALFRQILLGDPFGVYGTYSFPAINWLVFFSTSLSEVATFLLGFSLHKILAKFAEEFHGENIQLELRLMISAGTVVVIVNLALTLLNNIVGVPDSFFLVLNLYGIIQVYVFWYFFQTRTKVLQEETPRTQSATSGGKTGHREYQMRLSMQLLQGGLMVITAYVILFQPIAFGVLKLGACKSGYGNCSSLLAIFVLAVVVMNISAILQLMSLPGETKLQWEERMGLRAVKSVDGGTNGITRNGQSSQVLELDEADAVPSQLQQ